MVYESGRENRGGARNAGPDDAPPILVVDDEPSIVALLRLTLEQHGYRVETASNGVEALQKIIARKPRLLILDVMMPEMDGFELLRHVRDEPDLADLPVIVLTAKSQDADVATGYEAGADMYLTKAFHPDELLRFVRRLLPPPNGAP
jgi:DNA-binding response OmpR family regulator